MKLAKSSKKTKNSRSALRVEALESRQLLAGITGGGTEVLSNRFVESNGNTFDQVLMNGSSVSVTADTGQITRVSFLDLQGDIVQAEFSGKGTLTISLDQFGAPAEAAKYLQPGVNYVSGLASFTIQGSDSSTNFRVFTVGSATAVNQALFDATHTGGNNVADVARLTVVADPANFGGSNFGSILAGNAIFGATSGTVGISAANVNVQGVVRIGDIIADGTATPSLVLGVNSQFVDVEVTGGGLISTNGKAINNNGSFNYGLQFLDGTTSFGVLDPKEPAGSQLFTDNNPLGDIAPKTFSLTTLTDAGSAFTGASTNDTFVGAIGSDGLTSQGTTLNPGDALNGGAGTDTLSLSISGTNTAAQTTASFSATGVEVINVANFETSAFTNTIDLASVPNIGWITLTSSSPTGDTAFTSVQSIVAAAMQNGQGDLSLDFAAAAVVGTSDALTLTLANQTAGTFTADKIETLNVTSGTSANTVTLVGAQLKTVNVSGDKSLTLGTVPGTVTKVDASGLTAGKLTFTAATAQSHNVTGGAGDDSITLGTTFGSSDTVNGGDGADTLSVDVAITEATLKNVSNVETLKVTGAWSITLKDNVGPTNFDLTEAGLQTLTLDKTATGVVPATAFTNATSVSLGLGDKVDNKANVALTVSVKTADLGATTTITGGTGADVVNLSAATAGTADLTAVTGVETLNVTGSNATTINFANDTVVAADKTLVINGSALTGALTITGSAAETDGLLNITGGSGKDVLVGGGSGKDTLDGGAGDDSLSLAALKSTNVVSGGAGSDKLTVTGTAIASETVFGGVTGVETLALGGSVNLTVAGNLAATTGITTLDLTGGAAHVVTLKTGFTDALTVKMAGGGGDDKIDNQANTELTVNAKVADLTAGVTLVGGTGTDLINLTADDDATGATLTNVSGVEKITVLADSTNVDKDAKITLVGTGSIAADKTLEIDATALVDSGAKLTFVGDAAETNGFLKVTGGAGDDAITGGGSGKDTLIGGAGKDAITLATLTATNVIDGGDGTDTLTISNTLTTSAALAGVTGVESLVLGAANSLTLTSNIKTATGIGTITASGTPAAANTIEFAAGFTDAMTVAIGAGDQVKNTGANIALSVTANVADFAGGTATVSGGTGTDTLTLKADDGTAVLTNVTGVETVTVTKDAAKTATITVADANAASGKTFTVDASAVEGATTIDGSADTDGKLVIKGGTAGGTLTGGAGADTINGGAAADTIVGNAGNNVLTGAAGNDTISGGAGNNNVDGGAGDDTITVGNGNNTVAGGDGADTITVGTGANSVTAGAGNDIIKIGASVSTSTVDVGSGTDTIELLGRPVTSGALTSVTGMGVGDKINFAAVTPVAGVADGTLGAKLSLNPVVGFTGLLNAAASSTSGAATPLVKWFQFDGNTYVVVDNSDSSTFDESKDTVIQLVGTIDLSTSTLAAETLTIVTV